MGGLQAALHTKSLSPSITLIAMCFAACLPYPCPLLQDGVIVGIVVNCCRKKFTFEAAAGALIIFLLAIPSFLGKMLGFATGSFNVAKMSGSVKYVTPLCHKNAACA